MLPEKVASVADMPFAVRLFATTVPSLLTLNGAAYGLSSPAHIAYKESSEEDEFRATYVLPLPLVS